MSTTIDSLDIQIRTTSGSAAANIEALARSLESLKGASNLTKVTNSLKNLSTALDSLKTSMTGLRNLDKVAAAMQNLASIPKLTGLNSGLNALKKLPEVISSLQGASLSSFATNADKLSQVMSNLAAIPKLSGLSSALNTLNKLPAAIAGLDGAALSTFAGNANRLIPVMRGLAGIPKLSGLGSALSTLNRLPTIINGIEGASLGSFTAKMNSLVPAMQGLAAIPKLSGLGSGLNTLQKLPTIVASLNAVSLESFTNVATRLAPVMQSLAAIPKLSGLNSALNTLKKLPTILAGLDTSMLAEFTVKMRQLAEAMEPLATRINTVATAFSRLPARVSSMITGLNRLSQATEEAAQEQGSFRDSINATSLNLATVITNVQAFADALTWLTDGLTSFISQAIEWDGIQFRFGRAFGEDAEEAYAYVQKVNEALGINIQEFMQYSSLYGSLLSGFGIAQEKVTTISLGLTELSYDIWAAYNDRFKTLEDASEAVRSAITGEIEPIRNAGIALTEASMQEFADTYNAAAVAANDTTTAFETVAKEINATDQALSSVENTADNLATMIETGIGDAALQATADTLGLGVSVQTLTEAQKSELRYATMVNAAMNQGIVGTYAAEMNTAEGVVRNLSQQIKSLSQAIGSLFIPVLTAVIPWITAFVKILYDAVMAIANFFGIEMFEIQWGKAGTATGGVTKGLENVTNGASNATDALGEAGKAAKKLKDYTLGFDELNVIEPPSSSSGSGGSGGAGGADVGGLGPGDSLGLNLDTLWDDAMFANAETRVAQLKQKILDFLHEWKTQLLIIAGALGTMSMTNLLSSLGEALQVGDKFHGLLKNISKLAATAIIVTIQFSLMKSSLGDFIDGQGFLKYLEALLIGGISSYILYSQWGAGGLVIGLSIMAAASISAVIENGGITNAESATVAFTGLASAIGAVALARSTR